MMPLVAIGCSAGGVTALVKLLDELPETFRSPIVLVQHMPENHPVNARNIYGRRGREAVEIEDKMPLGESKVFVAPGGYHTCLEEGLYFSLSQDEPVNFSRPSIDVFFASAASVLGPNLIGVLLTGANSDGAEGLKRAQELGAVTIVQEPSEAEFSKMPEAALQILKPDHVVGLCELPALLGRLCGQNGAA